MFAKRFFYVSAGIFLLALAYHVGAMSARAQPNDSAIPEAITARELVIVDERGKPRATLGVLGGCPSMLLNDENGEMRAAVTLKSDGSPVMALSDAKGTVRVALHVGDEGAVLTLADMTRQARAQVAVAATGEPMLSLMDEAGTMRAAVGVGPNAEKRSVATFLLLDKNKQLVWRAP
ncbi:MAG TPA: hypothetical protein VGK89_01190 [Candidatus Eisenbacteria bacterium]|jgi:hypothetical protein